VASEVVDGVVVPLRVGGHPAVDFCNTRTAWDLPSPKEYLLDGGVLAVWAREVGLVDAPTARAARTAAAAAPRRARHVVRRAVELRSALHGMLRDGGPARADGWPVVSREAAFLASSSTLLPGDGDAPARWAPAVTTDPLLLPYLAVVRATAELLTTDLANHVRACPMPDCGWLFADPTGRRRWCSMAWCGNRAKARRYAARSRDRA
jgi:predicted RNA-binding Zn ribbon-like protein